MIRANLLTAQTPAKINLGLEVTGRREDGYHNIVSIFQAVGIFDEFVWSTTNTPFSYQPPSGIDSGNDLVKRVFDGTPGASSWTGRLSIEKRIPIAAGLGGGSSDAAFALRLAEHGAPLSTLMERAASLGADVPFFVRGGTALATGTGTHFEPLPTPALWIVIVVPAIQIEEKTRTLYSGLTKADYSDGSAVRAAASAIRAGAPVTGGLPNAFTRQLLAYDRFAKAYVALENAGARYVSTSGAGPAVLAYFHDYDEAARIAERVKGEFERVFLAETVSEHTDDSAIPAMARALRGGSASS